MTDYTQTPPQDKTKEAEKYTRHDADHEVETPRAARNIHHHTQVPNFLLDEILPARTPFEQVVLIHITRLTAGFHKERTKVGLSALVARTGMSRRKLIDVIANLERDGLLFADKTKYQTTVYSIPGMEPVDSSDISTGAPRAPQREKRGSAPHALVHHVHPIPPQSSAPRAPETSAPRAPIKEKDLLREIDLKEKYIYAPSDTCIEEAIEQETPLTLAKSKPKEQGKQLKTLEQALVKFPEEERGGLTDTVRKVCARLELSPDSTGHLVSERDDMANIKLKPSGIIGLITLFKERGLNGKHLEEACVVLSDYIANNPKGRRYTDHAAAIRSWVLDKIVKRQNDELVLTRNEIYLENASAPRIARRA